MPVKLRVPKARDDLIAPENLAEAVELFQRGLQLQAIGADGLAEYGEETPETDEYERIDKRLNWGLLGLACDLGVFDVRPGVETTGGSAPFLATAPRALRIREVLMKELRRSGRIL
jgi:hypothetical protein